MSAPSTTVRYRELRRRVLVVRVRGEQQLGSEDSGHGVQRRPFRRKNDSNGHVKQKSFAPGRSRSVRLVGPEIGQKRLACRPSDDMP